MIRSMTAYASAESPSPAGTLSCELRSVNHRYLELSPRLPEELRAFEPLLRERVERRVVARQGRRDRALAPAPRSDALQVDDTLLIAPGRAHMRPGRALSGVAGAISPNCCASPA